MPKLLMLLLALAFSLAAARPAAAAAEVDLELVLAIDVSRSVDEFEAKLQRDGYIAAFSNPRVVEAIQSGRIGAIAVTYVEWGGIEYQRTVIGWTLVHDDESASAFADALAEAPRISASWTSISGALDYAVRQFEDNGYEGLRKVIDISGDGRNNSGRPAAAARDDAVAAGVIVNGLAIMNDRPNFSRPPEQDLDLYYEQNVIGGPGAFLMTADDFTRFGAALLGKLIREIAGTEGQRAAIVDASD